MRHSVKWHSNFSRFSKYFCSIAILIIALISPLYEELASLSSKVLIPASRNGTASFLNLLGIGVLKGTSTTLWRIKGGYVGCVGVDECGFFGLLFFILALGFLFIAHRKKIKLHYWLAIFIFSLSFAFFLNVMRLSMVFLILDRMTHLHNQRFFYEQLRNCLRFVGLPLYSVGLFVIWVLFIKRKVNEIEPAI
jgi:hypothetical protein